MNLLNRLNRNKIIKIKFAKHPQKLLKLKIAKKAVEIKVLANH